jgi:hypothetical protein
MNSTADIKAGEEVTLTDVTRRIDAIVELLQRSPPPPKGLLERASSSNSRDSTGPLPWLNRCKCYFHVDRTLENRRVAYAAFHLLDDA